MPSEGAVNALKSAHAALRPGGLVLDLQPEVGDPPVEVVRGGRVIGSTPQNESWCAEQIAKAAVVVEELVRRLRVLMAGGADEIVKRERCVARLMRRLNR